MNKKSLLFAVLIGIGSLGLAGCGDESAASPGDAVVDEAELNASSFKGTYAPASPGDDVFSGGVRIDKVGADFVLHLDDYELPLKKTKSGAYVFSSGDFDGHCDDPGCSTITKLSGVVYLKKVGTKRVPSVKVTVLEEHPHPEFEGDLEGETTTTVRWSKKR